MKEVLLEFQQTVKGWKGNIINTFIQVTNGLDKVDKFLNLEIIQTSIRSRNLKSPIYWLNILKCYANKRVFALDFKGRLYVSDYRMTIWWSDLNDEKNKEERIYYVIGAIYITVPKQKKIFVDREELEEYQWFWSVVGKALWSTRYFVKVGKCIMRFID